MRPTDIISSSQPSQGQPQQRFPPNPSKTTHPRELQFPTRKPEKLRFPRACLQTPLIPEHPQVLSKAQPRIKVQSNVRNHYERLQRPEEHNQRHHWRRREDATETPEIQLEERNDSKWRRFEQLEQLKSYSKIESVNLHWHYILEASNHPAIIPNWSWQTK